MGYAIRSKETGFVFMDKKPDVYKEETQAIITLERIEKEDMKDGWYIPGQYIVTDENWTHPRDRW